MNRLSQLLIILLLAPMIYGAAGALGVLPASASRLPYWASPDAHLAIGGTAWLTVMGAVMLSASNRALTNVVGLALVVAAMGAQVVPDLRLALTIGIAVGALLAYLLNSPASWAKLNLPLSVIAVVCLLIGQYA